MPQVTVNKLKPDANEIDYSEPAKDICRLKVEVIRTLLALGAVAFIVAEVL